MKNKHVKLFNEHQVNKNLNISDVRNSKINELSSRENELFTRMTNTIFEIMSEGYLTKDEIIDWIKVHVDENLID
jgi:hypothetical protein